MLISLFLCLIWVAVAAAIAVTAASLIFPLPSLKARKESQSIPMNSETNLGRAVVGLGQGSLPGTSGILPLMHGVEAYAARIFIARAAQHSIDARYYIWEKDKSGLTLLAELRAAAQRGVRVRLLVDDHGTAHLDAELAMLNGLPNMEVRLFNPFTLRKPRLACYLFNFARLNRRMHNKSFSVDGATAILGGRNIGDVYFARDAEVQYFDFDLFAAGPVVAAVAEDFDAYWNCRSAYPHELLAAPTPGTDQVFDAEVKAANEGDDAQVYLDELNSTDVVNKLTSGTLSLDWVPVTLHSDRPIKGLRHLRSSKLLAAELTLILVKARTNVDIACAYFVPGRRGAKLLVSMARAGRTARILTNSLEATNVLPVHASYLKYRKRLLKGGVKLFEMKSSQSNDNRSFLGILGKSAACLHAKIFMMDNDKVFVGSFNFDPRSVFLNCEMGFLVESSQLSDLLMATFNRSLSQAAWAVNLRKDGELNWIGTDEEGNAVVRRDEPGSTSKRRLAMAVISRLPIEWLM